MTEKKLVKNISHGIEWVPYIRNRVKVCGIDYLSVKNYTLIKDLINNDIEFLCQLVELMQKEIKEMEK